MKKLTRKAFTLVELLIVIAIIAVLAVTALIALNPAETQKKARDTNRIKDANDLQAAFEQYIDSTPTIAATAGTVGGAGGATSSATAGAATNVGVKTMPCAANWLGIDVCAYIKTVPLDPSNGQDRTYAGGGAAGRMYYRAAIVAGNYEIDVRQESTSNASKITGDGGDATLWFEIFNGPNTVITGN